MDEVLRKIVSKGFLVQPNIKVDANLVDKFINYLESNWANKPLVTQEIYNNFLEMIKSNSLNDLKIIKNYRIIDKKIAVSDWVKYFKSRYEKIASILKNREELKDAVSIRTAKRLFGKEFKLIGLVYKIREYGDRKIVEIEDPTGRAKVYIDKTVKGSKELILDEVIGLIVNKYNNRFYATKIIFPDIPYIREKKSKEGYVVFLSDIHVGSKMFLEEKLEKFIKWINGKGKNPEIAEKTKYVFIAGDLVDGVDIYPEQENELSIADIYEQYEKFAYFIDRIPKDKKIVLIPGNHDAVRLQEPQPPFSKYAKALFKIKNVITLSNPSMVNIMSDNTFSGFNILLYHGYSFDRLISNYAFLRKGYEDPSLVMETLIKKRHLSIDYSSTLISPLNEDRLVIDVVPDIFVSGHTHRFGFRNYKGVLLISSSCFQARTSFQEKLGHEPTPGIVPVVDLKSNKVITLKF